MKAFKLYFIMVLTGLLSLSSCQDYFGDVNVDPDNPTTVPPNVILPQVQVRLAYTVGGDASRLTGIFSQHVDGVGLQWAVIHNNGVQPSDTDSFWGNNMYSAILMDNRQMINISTEAGNNHFVGVGKIIEAYAMMLVTDCWGDAPYTEAFQGLDVIQPAFDSQESIYNTIFQLLEEGRVLLRGDDGGFPLGSADLIYGGDADLWVKFANVLEARGLLHLSKRESGNYAKILPLLQEGFTSSADDALLNFGTNATTNAPWYQFVEQRVNNCEIGANYVALMQSLNDPRAATYGELFSTAHPILKPDRAFPLLTYKEAKFIEAEVLLRTSGAADALDPYLAGIAASFEDALVSADYDAYVAQEEVVPADGVTLNEVITQKYIALYLDPEAFSDWRRTGIPALTPNTPPAVPRRLPYGDNEVKSNENTPSLSDVTIYSRVWWDVE